MPCGVVHKALTNNLYDLIVTAMFINPYKNMYGTPSKVR